MLGSRRDFPEHSNVKHADDLVVSTQINYEVSQDGAEPFVFADHGCSDGAGRRQSSVKLHESSLEGSVRYSCVIHSCVN